MQTSDQLRTNSTPPSKDATYTDKGTMQRGNNEHISPAFLTLPLEIRTIIYRLLVCQDKPIGITYVRLNAAILRTCR